MDRAIPVAELDEPVACETPDPTDLEMPPAEGDRTGSAGSDWFGTAGVGIEGVLTVGTGTEGTLTVGTGTEARSPSAPSEGVVIGGVTGVEGTVSDPTVRAALTWRACRGPASNVRTSASSPNANPHRAARLSQPPHLWPHRRAASRPLITDDIYPALSKSNLRASPL